MHKDSKKTNYLLVSEYNVHDRQCFLAYFNTIKLNSLLKATYHIPSSFELINKQKINHIFVLYLVAPKQRW